MSNERTIPRADIAQALSSGIKDQYSHQSQLPPELNKFHAGNGVDGKHYWLTPPALMAQLDAEFNFNFDPCPFPKPNDFDGLTCEWGSSSYVNPPFGSIIHQGKKKGPTAWARKAIEEHQKGKRVVLVYPIDKWVLMLLGAGAKVRNLGDVRWCATEDGSQGKGTGRHIACFVLDHEDGAQLQGEPVFYAQTAKVENPAGWRGLIKAELDSANGYTVPFYTRPAEQPAPVAVVLPSADDLRSIIRKAARDADLMPGANYYTAAELAAEDVVSEVARLNPPQQ